MGENFNLWGQNSPKKGKFYKKPRAYLKFYFGKGRGKGEKGPVEFLSQKILNFLKNGKTVFFKKNGVWGRFFPFQKFFLCALPKGPKGALVFPRGKNWGKFFPFLG